MRAMELPARCGAELALNWVLASGPASSGALLDGSSTGLLKHLWLVARGLHPVIQMEPGDTAPRATHSLSAGRGIEHLHPLQLQREPTVKENVGSSQAAPQARGPFKHSTALLLALPFNFAAWALCESPSTCKHFGSASPVCKPQP